MFFKIAPELVGELARMCAEENARQKKWIYRFEFFLRWVHISRRPWAGENLEYKSVIKDTRATAKDLTKAIETLRRLIEEDG